MRAAGRSGDEIGCGEARTAFARRTLDYARPVDDLLLAWFSDNGRDLPWRETRDPYAILVSEVMLQQNDRKNVELAAKQPFPA